MRVTPRWNSIGAVVAAAIVLACVSCTMPGPSPEQAKAGLEAMRSKGRIDDVSETNFVYCAFMSDLAAVRLYLASGMSPDVRNAYGRTPLIAAITYDTSSPWSGSSDDVVKLLLARGADVNARDDEGSSALALARRANRPNIVDLLVANGATE